MRKVVAGAAVAAALAWAHGVRADETKTDQQKKAETQHKATGGAASAQHADAKHPLFEGKKNFDVDGKVQKASKDRVTIQRDKLPPATLHVAPGTKIVVDGKASSADQLKPGQDVKASFNLRGDTVEAVEIKAKKLDKDASKEMSEQQRENQKDLHTRPPQQPAAPPQQQR